MADLLLVPAAGAVRSFLFGCTAGRLAEALRAHGMREGTTVPAPFAFGAALSCFCVTYHVVRLTLRWIGMDSRRSAAASGAIAGSMLACMHPLVAAARSDIHATATISAGHLLLRRHAASRSRTGRRRTATRDFVAAAAPVAAGCASSWALLRATRDDAQPPHSGASRMEGCVPRFLVLELWQWRIMPVSNALADASASAAVSAVSSAGAPPPALATLGGRVVASRLCSILVVRLLSAVTSAGGRGRSAVVSTSLLELRAELCEMMMDAIASAALLITTLSLARAGGRAVSIFGWLPGLFLLLHATPRR